MVYISYFVFSFSYRDMLRRITLAVLQRFANLNSRLMDWISLFTGQMCPQTIDTNVFRGHLNILSMS